MALITSLLSPTTIFIAVISFIVIQVVRSSKNRSKFSKLPQPTGNWPVIGHSLLLLKKGVDITESAFEAFYKYSVEFHKYGLYAFQVPLQPAVFIFSPDYFEKLMTSTTHINKAFSYMPFLPWLGTGLIVSGGEKWQKDRKTLTPAFHFKILEKFNPLINKHARILCEKIRTTLNMEVSNCVSTLSACALDTICETSMGVDMKTQTSGKNSFTTNFIEFSKLGAKRSLSMLNQYEFLYSMTPDGRKTKQLIKNMHDFTGGIIRQRKKEIESTVDTEVEGKKQPKSLLDLMLDIHFNDNSLNLQDIQFQLDNFTFAGHDTVANAISFVLVCLANYTNIQDRVRAEVNGVIGNGLSDKQIEICSEHLSQFSYLEMVIKESMRVYPAVPFSGRHIYEDLTLGDHVIPKGTDVWLNYYALNRNPAYWPEPEKFDPERFSLENSLGRHPFAFVPFSAGQRNCIGQRYAKAFMKIVVAHIVAQFEIIPVTLIEDLRLSFELTIKTINPIQVKFKPLK